MQFIATVRYRVPQAPEEESLRMTFDETATLSQLPFFVADALCGEDEARNVHLEIEPDTYRWTEMDKKGTFLEKVSAEDAEEWIRLMKLMGSCVDRQCDAAKAKFDRLHDQQLYNAAVAGRPASYAQELWQFAQALCGSYYNLASGYAQFDVKGLAYLSRFVAGDTESGNR
jgi:hypothetical protein